MKNTLANQYLTAAAKYRDALARHDEDAAHDVIIAGFDAMQNRDSLPDNLRGYLFTALNNRIGKIKQRNGYVEETPDIADGGDINPSDTLRILLERLRLRFGCKDVEIYVDRVCGEPPRDIAKRLKVAPVQIYRVMNKVKAFLSTDSICQELKRDAYN